MTKDLRKRLGEKAKELREKAGLTQKEVVSKLNIDQGALSAFENHGEKIGSLEKVNELFEALGYELTVREKESSEKKTKLILRLPDSMPTLSPA